ncbi:MAG: hypothetical protein KDC38_18935, partial [Planctomycetes bacterium]|nr:hypothetical protein [Planctomycetota bacterium]
KLSPHAVRVEFRATIAAPPPELRLRWIRFSPRLGPVDVEIGSKHESLRLGHDTLVVTTATLTPTAKGPDTDERPSSTPARVSH